MTKIIAVADTIITNILTKAVIAVAGMSILTTITNIRTRTAIAIASMTITNITRTNIRMSIIMNTANVAVTKRSIRRTIMRATKIFCTTEKICPTS